MHEEEMLIGEAGKKYYMDTFSEQARKSINPYAVVKEV